MNYSLFPHSSLLNVHHTCKCIMHFSLFSLAQILWSPVSNQPGKGFAVLTHCLYCVFVPVYCAHCPHSAENWSAGFFSPCFLSTRFPKESKKPPNHPLSVWIVSQSFRNTYFAYKSGSNNFWNMEQGFALHTHTFHCSEPIQWRNPPPSFCIASVWRMHNWFSPLYFKPASLL